MVSASPQTNPLYDEHAERALLGTLLEDPERISEAQSILAGPEDFFATHHKVIYTMMEKRAAEGGEIDPLLIAQDLIDAKEDARVGGVVYLYDLLESPRGSNVPEYAARVRDLADRRVGITAASMFRGKCSDMEVDFALAKEQMNQRIQSRLLGRKVHTISVKTAVHAALERLNDQALRPRIIKTGMFQLDTILQITAGETGLLGGYPGIGKSALAREICFRVLGIRREKEGTHDEELRVLDQQEWPRHRVMLFSTEMDRELLTHSMFAQLGGVPVHCIRDETRRLKRHSARMVEAAAILESLGDRFYVNDTPRLTPEALVNETRLAAMKMGGIDLLVIDHINHMAGRERSEDMRLFTDRLVRDNILPVTKEMSCATITVSQLNRSGYNLTKPTKSLFKESGGLEESGFWAAILWENTTLASFLGKGERLTDLYFVKNKSGPEIRLPLVFHGPWMRHRQLSEDELLTYGTQDGAAPVTEDTKAEGTEEIPF